MSDHTLRVIAILRNYMRDPAHPVGSGTALSELGIDLLDLPMISLDLEDAFAVHVSHDDDIESFATVQALAACVAARLEAKASQPRRPSVPKKKSSWISTRA
jgi:acyl carrier protein